MSRVDVATLTELAAGVLEAGLIDPDSLAGGDFAARLESLLEAITRSAGHAHSRRVPPAATWRRRPTGHRGRRHATGHASREGRWGFEINKNEKEGQPRGRIDLNVCSCHAGQRQRQ